MKYIESEQGAVEDFLATFPQGKPVVMLNLLRFSAQARYEAGQDAEPCSGLEAYMRYGAAAMPLIEAVGGEQLWLGRPLSMLIGPSDKNWDLAVLVRYPDAQVFAEMVNSEQYRAIAFHRSAALEDSRLLAHEEL